MSEINMPIMGMRYTNAPFTRRDRGMRVTRERVSFGELSGTIVKNLRIHDEYDNRGELFATCTDEEFVVFIADDGTEYRSINALMDAVYSDDADEDI